MLDNSEEPILCPHCKLNSHKLEIEDLKNQVAQLRSILEERLSPAAIFSSSTSILPSISYAAALKSSSSVERTQPSFVNSDRKFNVVMYGTNECPEGMYKPQRVPQDHESVTDVIKTLDDTLDKQSVRDCFRLGRYSKDKQRPILVKLTCACQ